MRKGGLNLLGRRNQSLFDPTAEIKEFENKELYLNSSAFPESGTAKVRARPTVKHYASSSDLQGLAVPTPKAPLLPPVNGLQTLERGKGGKNSGNGSLAIPDPVEGEIFIPPPPSVAPPPPPQFIPPPPQFNGRLNLPTDSPALASLQPPPMPPPKPPSQFPIVEPDLASFEPPSATPPKPPVKPFGAKGTGFVASRPSNDQMFPEKPNFAPPQPPTLSAEQPQITYNKNKVPPPKPVRFSSIPIQDDVPPFSAPEPPTNKSTPSSFNPQNSAKLYNLPKTTILGGQNHEMKQKSIILLQDSPINDAFDQTNEKVSSALTDVPTKSPIPPVKPARRNSSANQLEKELEELKYNLQSTLPSQARLDGMKAYESSMKTEDPPLELSPKFKDLPTPSPSLESNTVKYSAGSPARNHKSYSTYSHVPSSQKPSNSSPSPLALLQAAKERDRQKHMSGNRSPKTNPSGDPSYTRIHPTESSSNSVMITPRSMSSSVTKVDQTDHPLPTMLQGFSSLQTVSVQPYQVHRGSELMEKTPNNLQPSAFVTSNKQAVQSDVRATPTVSFSTSFRDIENEDISVPLIPPPPEFANPDRENETSLVHAERPPSLPPPGPPSEKIIQPLSSFTVPSPQRHNPIPTLDHPSRTITQPLVSPSASTPQNNSSATPPVHSSQKVTVPPISSAVPTLQRNGPPSPALSAVPNSQTKGPPPPPKPKPSVTVPKPTMTTFSPQAQPKGFTPAFKSQTSLLSILQKKMLEMDQKNLLPQVDSASDDWGSPVSDEEIGNPFQKNTQPSQSQSLHLGKLESQVAKGSPVSTAKSTTSKGPQSKPPHGMTFTVRPGAKQPITLVGKQE